MTKTINKGHSVKSVCALLSISRQGYYKRVKKVKERELLYNSLEQIVIKNRQNKLRVGLRTIHTKEKLSQVVGINQFETVMKERGYALMRYKSYMKTTDSRGKHYLFDNLVAGKVLDGENQAISGDITYYQNRGERYYIFHFTDMYTKEVKGLIASKNMEGIVAEKCLRQVYQYNKIIKYGHKLKIHTDAGGQYRSHKFQSMLRKAKILPSHAKNCFENGLAERINGIIKNEYLVDYDIKSVSHLNRVLKKIKVSINEEWPSNKLGNKTPKQFAQMTRKMNIENRPKKLIKIVK